MYYRGTTPDLKREFTCYAESRDGIRWMRPELGLVEFDGSKQNNILLANTTLTLSITSTKRTTFTSSENSKATITECVNSKSSIAMAFVFDLVNTFRGQHRRILYDYHDNIAAGFTQLNVQRSNEQTDVPEPRSRAC